MACIRSDNSNVLQHTSGLVIDQRFLQLGDKVNIALILATIRQLGFGPYLETVPHLFEGVPTVETLIQTELLTKILQLFPIGRGISSIEMLYATQQKINDKITMYINRMLDSTVSPTEEMVLNQAKYFDSSKLKLNADSSMQRTEFLLRLHIMRNCLVALKAENPVSFEQASNGLAQKRLQEPLSKNKKCTQPIVTAQSMHTHLCTTVG